jgi:hypothetical protein
MLPRRRVLHRTPFEERLVEAGSRRWLVAELDRLTSAIVRRRDRRCVTCGSRRNLQCSHFYSRRHLALRFDLRNCHAMCGGCNRRHNSDPAPYLAFMLERYGPEVVAELDTLRGILRKVSDEELRRLLREYKSNTGRGGPGGYSRRIRLGRPDAAQDGHGAEGLSK